MEKFFLDLGLSFTMSKLLPYILMTLIGLVLSIIVFKKAKTKLTKIIAIILFFAPFGIYFSVNPIYSGDFSNNSRMVSMTTETSELNARKLVLIAMPGCPFCMMAINTLKQLKEKNPAMDIEFIVTSTDPETLAPYQEEINGAFPCKTSENPIAMADLAERRFPVFVLVDPTKKEFEIWNNNSFGVRAMDKVVNAF